jgi:ribosome-binding ATPase YchF (GTP1/OBG family)
MWIYDNICDKWTAIRKKPWKFVGMFSRYRASRALQICGVRDENDLVRKIPSWGPDNVHLVAVFMFMRFTSRLLLRNKNDEEPSFDALHEQLRGEYPDEVFIPLSAKAECSLLDLRKEHCIGDKQNHSQEKL